MSVEITALREPNAGRMALLLLLKDLRREFLHMRTRIIRTLSTIVSLLLLVAVPTQASPIKFVDVINVMGDLQKGGQVQQLKLRGALQDPTTKTIAITSASTVAPATDADPLAAGTSVAP